jgi:hypothetical protein
MTEKKEKLSPHDAVNNPTTARISILSLLRLSVGHVGDMQSNPPDDEEKELVEKIFKLRGALFETLNEEDTSMIVAMVSVTQLLEDILCHYENDMPSILTAIFTKLAHHGAQHMNLKDNPPREVKFTGTIH